MNGANQRKKKAETVFFHSRRMKTTENTMSGVLTNHFS